MGDSSAKRILIVEHDELTTETYARMLRLEGYEVRIALHAEDGLRDVESNQPDAILADFRMPDIDGLGFLRRLRTRKENQNTPVAIITGDYFLDELIPVQLRELGATIRYKPLWLDDLGKLVRELVGDIDPAT
jgi:two-component system OmpR family response regulator